MATGQYDDAWETPGWTAQNMAYPPGDPDLPVTAVPSVKAFGLFLTDTGLPEHGLIRAEPSVRVTTHNGAVVVLSQVVRELVRGAVLFDLPVGPWSWTIRMRIGPTTSIYTVSPDGDLNLSELQDGSYSGEVDGGVPGTDEVVFDGGAPDSIFTEYLDGGTP